MLLVLSEMWQHGLKCTLPYSLQLRSVTGHYNSVCTSCHCFMEQNTINYFRGQGYVKDPAYTNAVFRVIKVVPQTKILPMEVQRDFYPDNSTKLLLVTYFRQNRNILKKFHCLENLFNFQRLRPWHYPLSIIKGLPPRDFYESLQTRLKSNIHWKEMLFHHMLLAKWYPLPATLPDASLQPGYYGAWRLKPLFRKLPVRKYMLLYLVLMLCFICVNWCSSCLASVG